MAGKKSLADLLRNHIREQLAQNYDYSLASNRKADIEIFISRNQMNLDKKQTAKSIRPSHDKILDEQLKNKGIDPKSLGRVSKKPRFNSDLNPKITPEPQAGVVDSSPKPKAGQEPIPQGGVVPVVPETFDVKAVSASINSLYLMLRTIYPDLELLTDEEKESLGSLWKSAFNKYLTDNFAEIVIPLMATFGIFAPKILEARKKKKERSGIIKETTTETQKSDIEKIKKEVIENQEKEKEASSQEQQKIKQQVAENEALPKSPELGKVDTEIHIPKDKN